MPRQILRRKDARARFSVKRAKFDEDFVLRADDDPFVRGTDDSVLLAPVRLGARYVGFFDDEAFNAAAIA